jgi:flagellar hook-basal body complex protein FliE
MSEIKNINLLLPNKLSETTKQTPEKSDTSFSDILKKSIEQVNNAQLQADEAIKKAVSGENTDIHDTMIAIQKADVSLKLMMEVRNKLLEAYQDIMRTQV